MKTSSPAATASSPSLDHDKQSLHDGQNGSTTGSSEPSSVADIVRMLDHQMTFPNALTEVEDIDHVGFCRFAQ